MRTVPQRHDIGFLPGEVARMGAANLLCRTGGDELIVGGLWTSGRDSLAVTRTLDARGSQTRA